MATPQPRDITGPGWRIPTSDIKLIAALILGVVALIAAIFLDDSARTGAIAIASACGGFIVGQAAPKK